MSRAPLSSCFEVLNGIYPEWSSRLWTSEVHLPATYRGHIKGSLIEGGLWKREKRALTEGCLMDWNYYFVGVWPPHCWQVGSHSELRFQLTGCSRIPALGRRTSAVPSINVEHTVFACLVWAPASPLRRKVTTTNQTEYTLRPNALCLSTACVPLVLTHTHTHSWRSQDFITGSEQLSSNTNQSSYPATIIFSVLHPQNGPYSPNAR